MFHQRASNLRLSIERWIFGKRDKRYKKITRAQRTYINATNKSEHDIIGDIGAARMLSRFNYREIAEKLAWKKRKERLTLAGV